jgi:hypothetical protein
MNINYWKKIKEYLKFNHNHMIQQLGQLKLVEFKQVKLLFKIF